MDVLHVFPTVPFGNYVEVDVPNSGNNQTFTGAVSVDEKEELIKVIVAKDNRPGPVTLKLNNIPLIPAVLRWICIRLWTKKMTVCSFKENSPRLWQVRILNYFWRGGHGSEYSLDGDCKTDRSKPEFFHPKTPDDGEAAESQPTFTWSESRGQRAIP